MVDIDYDIHADPIETLKVQTGNSYKVTILTNVGDVRIFRLLGLIFEANKCFLLPYALPGIKNLVKMHQENKDSQILIVGHDSDTENFGGVDIARCRAQIMCDYLTNNIDSWTEWFKANKPRSVRWGTREVQLMLSALPEEGEPFYLGSASGITDDKTKESVKKFQEYCNSDMGGSLKVDGKAGPNTQKELIRAYMELEDTSVTENLSLTAHGCEGKFEDDLTLEGMMPDDRVLEVLFFDKGIYPYPVKQTSVEGDNEYFAWKKKVVETQNFEFHGIHIQILDKKKKPVVSSKVVLEGPTHRICFTDDQGFAFFSGLLEGEYSVKAFKDRKEISSSTLTYPDVKPMTRKD